MGRGGAGKKRMREGREGEHVKCSWSIHSTANATMICCFISMNTIIISHECADSQVLLSGEDGYSVLLGAGVSQLPYSVM